jgi:hypothetical protein
MQSAVMPMGGVLALDLQNYSYVLGCCVASPNILTYCRFKLWRWLPLKICEQMRSTSAWQMKWWMCLEVCIFHVDFVFFGYMKLFELTGSNNNNYANINLICEIAMRSRVDAVIPMWGHASENPLLPSSMLRKLDRHFSLLLSFLSRRFVTAES